MTAQDSVDAVIAHLKSFGGRGRAHRRGADPETIGLVRSQILENLLEDLLERDRP